MTIPLKIISYIGLALCLIAGPLVFAGKIDLDTSKNVLITGMLMWFLTAVFWIKPSSLDEEDS